MNGFGRTSQNADWPKERSGLVRSWPRWECMGKIESEKESSELSSAQPGGDCLCREAEAGGC